MCGIAGFHTDKMNREDSLSAVHLMNERMIHRGPDAEGTYFDEGSGICLGHRRLSIQDISNNGAQPMISHGERYVIAYNGEIYNAPELKKLLEKEGYVSDWRGSSDTEILLELISAYGVHRTLTLIKGMFAFALLDREDKTLTLARDRVGEKPLYYGLCGEELIFGSDIDVIRAYPGFIPEIDKEALNLYLRYGFVPAPHSIYKGIYKVMPGTYITFASPFMEGGSNIYYDLATEYSHGKNEGRFTGSFTEAVDELERTMKTAVKSELLSDVPLGAFLSGGIDSSAVVALMQSVVSDPVKTFTIGFEDKKYDESDAAEAIAKHLGTDHTILTISEKELLDVVPLMADIYTEPFADSSEIPTYLVSKLAKSKVTVSLSGDAGDELFGGYNTYWKTAALYNKLSAFPGGLKKTAGSILSNSSTNDIYRTAGCLKAKDIANLHEAVCYDMTPMSPSHIRQPLLLQNELKAGSAAPEDEMMLRDLLRYHPDDILVKVDRAGMAVSLENRVPMLDTEVLSLAYSLPVKYKIGRDDSGNVISNYVLKEMLYRYVPKELMDRPKKGFSVPLNKWLCSGPVHDMAWDILTDSRLVADGLIDKAWLAKLMKLFERKNLNTSLLWSVFVLEQWYRKYHATA